MRGTIDDGAEVLVETGAPRRIRAGDIVLYTEAGHLICHRVLRRRGASLVTKGDALRTAAGGVPVSSLIGRVIAIEIDGRRRSLTSPRERARALTALARGWLDLLRAA